jgi:endoglucanase
VVRYVAVALMMLSICLSLEAAEKDGFEIHRGVNISHWLSQSGRRGQERREVFKEKDVEYIASLGYDHIRLPVDEEQLWDEAGNKEPEAFELLHDGIGWAKKNGLRVIVDLHILRSHHFNEAVKPLWTDPKAQEKFFALWRDLSAELKKYPVSLMAYELMNEPVADDTEQWNKLVETLVRQVRRDEPHRKIVIGSNKWQSVDTFDQLRIPPTLAWAVRPDLAFTPGRLSCSISSPCRSEPACRTKLIRTARGTWIRSTCDGQEIPA